MVQRTKIEWADYTVNPLKFNVPGQDKPVNLCVKCSAGCAGCYAEAIGNRFNGTRYSLDVMKSATPVVVEADIQHILKFKPRPPFKRGQVNPRAVGGWRRPLVFPCDMTDLFGDWVPFEIVDKFMAAFALRPDVDFAILTKRPARMAEYLNWSTRENRIRPLMRRHLIGTQCEEIAFEWTLGQFDRTHYNPERRSLRKWPLPNVWLGVSAENQAAADKRIPHLLRFPAAVRFVSCEPLIGPIDLSRWFPRDPYYNAICEHCGYTGSSETFNEIRYHDDADVECSSCMRRTVADEIGSIDWVISGGESGPGARPCNVEWIRSIISQCRDADVRVFNKQLGAKPMDTTRNVGLAPGVALDKFNVRKQLKNPKGGAPAEWPESLRVREWPETTQSK